MKRWRLALKRRKPDILLLAEDKASSPLVFDERFDLAYDWGPSIARVSEWAWMGVFGGGAAKLRDALTNYGKGFPPRAKIFRYLENNDSPRFLESYGLDWTRMAAPLLFSVSGVPEMYNGQEVGVAGHPYQATAIFDRDRSIASKDEYGVLSMYQGLIRMRRMFPALISDSLNFIRASSSYGQVIGIHRWKGSQHVFLMLNLGSNRMSANIRIAVDSLGLQDGRTYYLTDVLTGSAFSVTRESLQAFYYWMNPVSSAVLVLDTLMLASVFTSVGQTGAGTPQVFELCRNYPNPFNPSTVIRYAIPGTSSVRLVVYDILGREVRTLVHGRQAAGRYEVRFDASGLASGAYFYRLEAGSRAQCRSMIFVR